MVSLPEDVVLVPVVLGVPLPVSWSVLLPGFPTGEPSCGDRSEEVDPLPLLVLVVAVAPWEEEDEDDEDVEVVPSLLLVVP